MRYSSRVKPISYLKANAAEVLTHLAEQREPMVITQNGEAKAECAADTEAASLTSNSQCVRRCCQAPQRSAGGSGQTAELVLQAALAHG